MKSLLSSSLLLATTLTANAIKVREPAPNFTLNSADGRKISLSDFKGKTVVLEWKNHGCPYVKKHYNTKNMQGLQSEAKKDGVVWLSVISSAEGKQGYSTPKQALADARKHNSKPEAILLDPKGTVGKLYGARTTPHMYVVNEDGLLAYQGAIDAADGDFDEMPHPKNYVTNALLAVKAKKFPKVANNQPYGCSVKYK